MTNLGYVRVAAAVPPVRVADCGFNSSIIIDMFAEAAKKGVEIIVFPELCVTGYTCGDLFEQSLLLESADSSIGYILENTADTDTVGIIGAPLRHKGSIVNAAIVFCHGRIAGVVPKTYLPNYKEFYEKRWFISAQQLRPDETIEVAGQTVPMRTDIIFDIARARFAVEICEDLWAPIPPSSRHTINGAEIVFNLSADNECVGKHEYLLELIRQQSARCLAGYVFSSCGYGESTTDLVFAGNGIVCETGTQLAHSNRFSLDRQLTVCDIDIDKINNDRRINTTFAESRGVHADNYLFVQIDSPAPMRTDIMHPIDRTPFVPCGKALDDRCHEIFNIQTLGLARRVQHAKCQSLVVGISGGLDSTLALIIAVKTCDLLKLDRTSIIGVTMPGFGTTDRTYSNAIKLMTKLGVTIREVNIADACLQHFKDINHNPDVHDVTYENSQARERTQILMDIANQTGGIVVGTGDLSELALGWATYNGDHMSMYGVNASVPKTLVRHLVEWYAKGDPDTRDILLDILDTPISPELIPADDKGNIAQRTEDLVGPYELHDFFLYSFLRNGYSPRKIYALAKVAFADTYPSHIIYQWLSTFIRRFFNQQFKRSCLPDGPKVGLSLSPRGDWRMPSDAVAHLWLNDFDINDSDIQ
ncbi:MAG: NAD(+) synthase [Bacteroidales bacterium]|nr:NAD(+) synthase [Bacteroidales bacterium]